MPGPVASQCGACQSHNALTNVAGDISPWQLVCCWTPERRCFVKPFENDGSPSAEEMMRQIALLYWIEEVVRARFLPNASQSGVRTLRRSSPRSGHGSKSNSRIPQKSHWAKTSTTPSPSGPS